ncbi:MAG: PDZ domain-containing protein [Pyrinomonadaceae bacterium]|nr:PDZ domain-containing protein [Pyrinomonadaceae bacterium]
MRTVTRKLLIHLSLASFLLAGFTIISGQERPLSSVTYRLSMSRPQSHLFAVKIEVELPENAPESLDFQMARWSPGRYSVFNFAKNVQEFRADAGICSPGSLCDLSHRPVTRVDDQTWRVPTMNSSSLTITYKVFANDLSGTFSQLDPRHANFNGGSVFMYIVNHKSDPVRLVINPPPTWRIINGQMERSDQREWSFPNWDIMIDTPTEIAPDWTREEFQVQGKKYHVMVHSFGDEGGKRPALVRDIEKIVRAETAMWGPPEFDAYTFLIHFAADDHSGDGMEHLTSTQIIQPRALADPGMYEDALGTVAHEFFHVWNVKRLRPIEFGPWDFTRPANTRSLWIAEGLTNYYGHLMMTRAGIWDESRFLDREGETITNIENAPGSRLMSAEESSLTAPFIDRAQHIQRTNLANTSFSYYPKGELLGLVLDLLIRGRTEGQKSLDDVMRLMYEEFYLNSPNATYYLRGRGYRSEEFQRVVSEVAGSDFSEFFAKHVRSVEVPPYDEALNYVGLRLVRQPAGEPYSGGISVNVSDPGPAIIANVRNGTAAEDAGLQVDDEIRTIGGRRVSSREWLETLSRYKQGSRVPVSYKRDGRTLQTTLLVGSPDRFEYRIEDKQDATAGQKALRAAWLRG